MLRSCCVLLCVSFVLAGTARSQSVDIVIRDATIYDGTGSQPMVGHVAFKEGQITSVGSGPGPEAATVIDGTGMVVAPGFIDLHTHSDRGVIDEESRGCVNYLMQGCTTSITGNCGSGPVDVGAYYDKIDAAGAGTNVGHLLPQGSLRGQVVGNVDRKATAQEVAEMRQLARKAMKDGAWGMSTGLIYTPGIYSTTAELIEIAKEVSAGNGIYASHIRGEGDTLSAAVKEAIEIGRVAKLPAHVSHLKASGMSNWGTLRLAMNLIDEAREKGQKVTADQYPYTASSTSLDATLFPGWSRSGGSKQLIKRLDEPETGEKIRKSVSNSLAGKSDGERVFIASFGKKPKWVGKNLKQIAEAEGQTPLEISEFIVRNGGASVVNFSMSEDDVRMAMTSPWVATASDGSARVPGPSKPHPRSYGTFPRKIGYYSIREKVIPLEQAIRSASGLPADIIGMMDRGYLKPGQAADIVVFNPEEFVDLATFDEPYQEPAGIKHVFVNGVAAVSGGKPTGALAGRALRKTKEK